MKKELFGKTASGENVYIYSIENGDLSLEVITYGGRIRSLSRDGIEMIGGYESLAEYENDNASHGALIGRYANRIKDGKFIIDGVEYSLAKNEKGKNHIHGGNIGYSKRIWDVSEVSDDRIKLSLLSPDGEENYPGNLNVSVTYLLSGSSLAIEYAATCDKACPINLTNHAYFNIGGIGSGSVMEHSLMINAESYSEIDDELIPTGERPSVEGTRFDFRKPRRIADGMGGYDHNFIICDSPKELICGKELTLAAITEGGGYRMSVHTDKPCIQLYTGNFMDSGTFRGGIKCVPQEALCLETQFEPNSPGIGKAIYGPGEIYRFTTVYTISKI